MKGQSLVLSKKGKSEKKHLFYLRSYRPGDEQGITECVRDEYGDTYFKKWFYEEKEIRKKVEDGSVTILVAEHFEEGKKREIAGFMILKEDRPSKTMCEIASQILRKKYRGYGLTKEFFGYGLKVLNTGDYSSALCLPVLFHNVSQRLLYDRGLRATGLILNVFDMEHITHSYENGRNQKHSQGVQVSARKKNKTGTLYIPREFQSICRMIYKELNVEFQMAADKEKKRKMPQHTILSSSLNKKYHSLTVEVNTVGRDFGKVMKKIQKAYPLNGRRTANLFINCNDKNAVWAWREMKGKAWFFTGLLPLCSEREYMIFHNPGKVDIYFEDYELSTEFANLTEYISAEYERSRVSLKRGEL